MTPAVPAAVLIGSVRAEAVTVLANMTMAALEGGGDEQRNKNQQHAPQPPGGDLPAAVVDGPGPRTYRVHDTPVRPSRRGGPAGLGPPRCGGHRHRSGSLRPVGRDPAGVHRAGGPGVLRRGRGDLRDRDLPTGPLQCRGGQVDGVRRDHRNAAHRRRWHLRSPRCQRPDAARDEKHPRGKSSCM